MSFKENYKIYIILLFSFYYIIIVNSQNNNPTNIPELLDYKSQSLHLLIHSGKCQPTLYFFPEYIERDEFIKTKKISLNDKNCFVTFYENDIFYVENKIFLLKNGLIKSDFKYGKNNLFLGAIIKNPSFINKSNLYNMNKYQKAFRYLNSDYLFQKNMLYKAYSSMKKLFPEDFDYMPETFYYPEQKNLIDNKFKNYNLNVNDLWLIKPTNLGEGHLINMFESLDNIKLEQFVITKYIKDINLISGKKYDLRLYALISGLKPLRIYFYKEGQVRIASEIFSLNETNIKNRFSHLTNIAVNKYNKNFIFPNKSNDYAANTWNLLMYKKFLNNIGIQWENISEKIKDIIIKSIISVYNNLTEEIEKQNLSDQNFYEILGFDILITDKFIPRLIEINYNPDMRVFNNNTKSGQINLFIDTLNLIGIVPFNRKTDKSLFQEFQFELIIDENLNNAFCELERPKGNYELIFPTKKNIDIYEKYFINNNKENQKFWEKIASFY